MNIYSPVISGSLTVTGSTNFLGNVVMSGSLTFLSGSLTGTASNSDLLSGTGSVGFTTTGSFATMSGSVSSRVSQIETVYATTGSNSFRATQSITGSLTVTGQIIAQTLNVQQVTSSIVYSSGSNVFGCDINSRQTFTGSVYITGSLVQINTVCNIGGGALNINGDLRFGGVGGQNYCIVNYQGGCLQLGTNNSPYLTIAPNGATTLSCQLYLDGCNRDTVFVKPNNVCYSRLFYAGGNQIVFHNGGTTANGGAWGLNNYEDTTGLFRVYNSGTSCWWGNKVVCGNIGISCSSAKFYQLVSNCKSNDSVLDIYNTATDGYGASIQAGAESSNYSLQVQNYSGRAIFYAAGNGNIGIGTNNPGAKLHIVSGNCVNAISIYGCNSSYISQIGFFDTTNVVPSGDGVGGQRIGIIEIETVAGSGTGCRGAHMNLYTHEANGCLKLPMKLTHNGNVCISGVLVSSGTPLQIVTGTTTWSSGPSDNSTGLGPSAGGATPGYNCGCVITSVSFTPKLSSSKILIQTTNVAMWETSNISDHFYLWASNDTAGTVLTKAGSYLQAFGQTNNNGAIVHLNGIANSWGTSSNTIAFRAGSSGGGTAYQYNPYYNAGGFNADTVGFFSYTIMEIA